MDQRWRCACGQRRSTAAGQPCEKRAARDGGGAARCFFSLVIVHAHIYPSEWVVSDPQYTSKWAGSGAQTVTRLTGAP
jgi:hypothetical protein